MKTAKNKNKKDADSMDVAVRLDPVGGAHFVAADVAPAPTPDEGASLADLQHKVALKQQVRLEAATRASRRHVICLAGKGGVLATVGNCMTMLYSGTQDLHHEIWCWSFNFGVWQPPHCWPVVVVLVCLKDSLIFTRQCWRRIHSPPRPARTIPARMHPALQF